MRSLSIKIFYFFLFIYFQFEASSSQNKIWNASDAYQFFDIDKLRISPNGKKIAILLAQAEDEWKSRIYLLEIDKGQGNFLNLRHQDISWIEWLSDTQLAYLASENGIFNLYSATFEPSTNKIIQVDQHTDLHHSIEYFVPSPSGKKIALSLSGFTQELASPKGITIVNNSPFPIHQLYLMDSWDNMKTDDNLILLSLPNRSLSTKKPNIAWSPKEDSLVYVEQPFALAESEPLSKLVRVDLKSGNASYLPTGSGFDLYPCFSRTGEQLAFVKANPMSKELRNASYSVYLYDFSSKQVIPLAKTFDQGPEIIGWSSDGNEIVVFEFFKSSFRLYAVPVNGKPPYALSSENKAVINPILYHDDVYFISHDFDRPDEIYSLNLKTGSSKRLSSIQPQDSSPKITVQNLKWLSSDGLTIEGTLLLPETTHQKPIPLVVFAHGGPNSNINNAFAGIPYDFSFPAMPALFTSRNMAVLWVYFRGSNGYGLNFRWSNYRNFCKGPYHDIISGVKKLVDQGIADPKKISLLGWSYGGYLGCYAATQENPFSSIAVWAPFTDLFSLFGTQDITLYLPTYFGGFPTQIPKLYTEQSPIHLINEHMSTPIMLLHGTSDKRVPVTQSQEFYSLIKILEISSKLILFENEKHILRKPSYQIFAQEEILKWFQRWHDVSSPSGRRLVMDSSGIHQSLASKIIIIKSEQQIKEVLANAKKENLKVTILGKKHSQASQVTYEGSLALDMTSYDDILEIDQKNRQVRVQSGCTWEKLQQALQPMGLAPSIMQSLNNFTIGGSISSNIVGRDPRKSSIQESVVSLKLMLADGTIKTCSRNENRELFSAVIGGFGLFGIILEATLQLEMDQCLVLESFEISTDDYANYLRTIKVGNGSVLYHAALFTLAKAHPFQKAFIITYFSPEQVAKPELKLTANNLKNTEYKLPPALSTYGFATKQKASSLYFLPEGSLNFVGCGIPLARFSDFMKEVETLILKLNIPVSESTTKIIKKDDLTMLPLVTENDTVVFIVAYPQAYSLEALMAAKKFKKEIGKLSLIFGGRPYLTFDYDVSSKELDEGYPRWREFLNMKKDYDPNEIYYSDFYQHLLKLQTTPHSSQE